MRFDVSVRLHRGGGVGTACAFVILQVLACLGLEGRVRA